MLYLIGIKSNIITNRHLLEKKTYKSLETCALQASLLSKLHWKNMQKEPANILKATGKKSVHHLILFLQQHLYLHVTRLFIKNLAIYSFKNWLFKNSLFCHVYTETCILLVGKMPSAPANNIYTNPGKPEFHIQC